MVFIAKPPIGQPIPALILKKLQVVGVAESSDNPLLLGLRRVDNIESVGLGRPFGASQSRDTINSGGEYFPWCGRTDMRVVDIHIRDSVQMAYSGTVWTLGASCEDAVN